VADVGDRVTTTLRPADAEREIPQIWPSVVGLADAPPLPRGDERFALLNWFSSPCLFFFFFFFVCFRFFIRVKPTTFKRLLQASAIKQKKTARPVI